jgi:hypothetical protein
MFVLSMVLMSLFLSFGLSWRIQKDIRASSHGSVTIHLDRQERGWVSSNLSSGLNRRTIQRAGVCL